MPREIVLVCLHCLVEWNPQCPERLCWFVCIGWLNGILNVQRDCVGLFALVGLMES